MGMPVSSAARVTAFPRAAVAVTPNDSVDLSEPMTVIAGTAGAVAVIPASGGASVVFAGIQAGQAVPVLVSRVLATGTTATGLVGVF